MIVQPSRRDLLKYSGAGLIASKLHGQGMPFPGSGLVHAVSGGGGGPAIVAHQTFANQSGGTSVGINTTGANFLVIGAAYYNNNGPLVVTDSKSNTWSSLTAYLDGGTKAAQLFYVQNPTVGSGHTFTVAGNGGSIYTSFEVIAWSGMVTSSVFQTGTDHGNHNNAATVLKPGSTAPSGSTLLITAFGFDATNTASIDSSFIIEDQIQKDGGTGTTYGSAIAYLIQPSGSTVDPQWSVGSTASLTSAIAAFTGT